MKEKMKKRIYLSAVVAVITVLLCFAVIFTSGLLVVSAQSTTFSGYSGSMGRKDLYEATNTYAYHGDNVYGVGSMEYRTYEYFDVSDAGRISHAPLSDAPQITVLTHGLDGDASHWSNNSLNVEWKKGEEFQFSYSEDSFMTRLENELLGEGCVKVYWAKMYNHPSFFLSSSFSENNYMIK